MKLMLPFFLVFLSQAWASPSVKELKIDPSWKIKFDNTVWDYTYLKSFNAISPHVLTHKKENFKLILQRETHVENQTDLSALVAKKCGEANQYYAKEKSGSARVEKINGTKLCYIEYKNASEQTVREFVYPEKSAGKNYDLFTYVWNSKDAQTKQMVADFLKGFVK